MEGEIGDKKIRVGMIFTLKFDIGNFRSNKMVLIQTSQAKNALFKPHSNETTQR